MILIRAATIQDSPDIVRVIQAVYDEYGFTWDADGYHADLYDIDTHYTRVGGAFFVALLNDEVVGTGALSVFPKLPGDALQELSGQVRIGGCDCSLDRLYVDPAARRNGIGASLTARVVETARALGRHRMEIWSDKRFVDAHRLYGRFGAVVMGDRICDDPDVSPEWGLVLDLD